MYKKFICVLLVCIMTLCTMGSSILFAEEPLSVELNGKPLTFEDVLPTILQDRTMVPIRVIFEALGAEVDWDDTLKTAYAKKGGKTVSLKIDEPAIVVDGNAVPLDQPAVILNDRTMVPLRAVSEAFGCEVNWDGEKRLVSILTQINADELDLPTDTIYNYFILAAAFQELGTFTIQGNKEYYEGATLLGQSSGKPEETENAVYHLAVDGTGRYSVWGHARDYATNQPGTRQLQLKVNDTLFDQILGAHGEEGTKWVKVGEIDLKKGDVTIEVVDTAAFYGRLDGIFLSNDLTLEPKQDFEEMKEIATPIGAIDYDNIVFPPSYHVRDGVPNFYNKIQNKETIQVGYIGGSNTQAEGYRVMSFDWFRQQYPDASFELVSAGVSGTGTDLAAIRVKEDIIDKGCDLVFVEFAGNDTGRARKDVIECLEGIVRQIWEADANTDIVFLYTLHESDMNAPLRGEYHLIPRYMEEVAEQYGVPSVYMGIEIVKLILNGEAVFRASADAGDKFVFSTDGTHPTSEGHRRIYLEAIKEAFFAMEEKNTALAHSIPAPIVSDRMQTVEMLDPRKANPSAGWTWCDPATDSVAKAFTYMFDGFFHAEKPGETLSFKFRGTNVGVYDVGGPAAGQLIVNVDGKAYLLERFTSYSYRNRPQYIFLPEVLEDGEHTVTITLGTGQADKESIMKNAGHSYDKATFDKTEVNIGKILIVGEVL